MYAGGPIKRMRQGLDMSQEEISSILGISQSYYSSIEKGKKPISEKLIRLLYDRLGIIMHKKSAYFDGGEVVDNYGGIDIDIHGGIDKSIKSKVEKFKSIYKQSQSNINNPNITLRSDFSDSEKKRASELPVMLDLNITKKLILDIKAMNNEITRISNAIHEFTSLENIIESIEAEYFSDLIDVQRNKSIYYDGKSFDYLSYKKEVINEYQKCMKYLNVLEKFSIAIEGFYEEFQSLDDKNVIDGFFGRNLDKK